MASAAQLSGPIEVSEGSHSHSKDAPTPEKCKSYFDLGITLALFLWPSLTLAVVSQWGGPDSSAKREWFAQTIIDLLAENPDEDAEWIEEFLLNVMLDEFEVNVEDDSALEVAETIVRLRKQCGEGDWTEVLAMKERWDGRQGRESEQLGRFDRGVDEEFETSGSEDDEGVGMDIGGSEVPQLAGVRKPIAPQVDEDGFTKVMKKRR